MTESSIKASRAWTELQAQRHQWGERIPGDAAKLLPWLIALPISELCDLIALCVSLTLDAVQSSPLSHPSDALADAVGLEANPRGIGSCQPIQSTNTRRRYTQIALRREAES